jgi:hypothetical protein
LTQRKEILEFVMTELIPFPGGQSSSEVTDKIILSIAGEDEFLSYEQFGLSFNSSDEEVLTAIRPMIQEKYNVDLRDGSSWLYKTRKAVSNRNIHIIPNSTAGSGAAQESIGFLDNAERLKIYDTLISGCQHLWSKNKPQEEKITQALNDFSVLAEKDPLFLAHFTSFSCKKLDSKDLKVIATFVNSLSDADGTPFSLGSEFKKPNWRIVSQAAFCELDPKLALRVLKLANTKRSVGSKPSATHFSRHLKTAATKYLRYRESNPKILEGIKKAGLGNTLKSIYRIARIAPSPEACQILRWKQKAGFPGAGVEIKKSAFDFTGLTELQIAEKIRQDKLKPQAVLGALPDKISPVIAAAVLEQCSGDQAVVLTSLFEEQGLLKDKEVKALYEKKIRTAKQALDRVERIKQEMDEETKAVMKQAKADVRKEQVGDIGKIYIHLDISGSMQVALQTAKKRGAIIAECVRDPEINFHWGAFNNRGFALPRPVKFTEDGFHSALYGLIAGGGTDCFALFPEARRLGCTTDFYITDGQHTQGDASARLKMLQDQGMPKQVVIIKCGQYIPTLENAFRALQIPVAVIDEKQLTESALVTQAIRQASLGSQTVIEDVLAQPLLSLPKWWYSIR